MKNLIIALFILGFTLSGKAQDTLFFAPEGFPVFT
jgi:hypothetical protein